MNPQFRTLVILGIVATATFQVSAKAWRGIEPLRSTKADVIRLLNRCADDLRICSFELEDEQVSIQFSSPLRTRDPQYACVGDLPLGTVLRIEITPKGSLQFNWKDFGQNSFKTYDPSPHRTGTYRAYLDRNSGLLINTLEGRSWR